MEISRQEAKQKAIKKELLKLRRITKNLSDDKKRAAEGLIQEAAFMRATLGELREIIDREGPVEIFRQGDYEYNREHPAVKSYSTMIQRYSTVCKQILDLLPQDKPKTEADELMEFVKKARK
ncbi:hypothetical protein [Desulfoscipio geothermicus]|uniref:Uncharacterized protein n=1 Tax=Desulfoscipio geothermicus DSM 3669 TaxID=1121426 RepID=A0A1I6ECR5_9FIRM|nr:hypothetical protein [Desulfoscipio geothermicus]SFR15288.1 hypothetical protein SAMN05660706_13512 [Desulfoscipio geothermicus DSM 3669]